MPFFAAQYALVICNLISCIPAIPSLIYPVSSAGWHASMVSFFDTLPEPADQPLIKLMMKFQFLALFAVYILGVFAAVFVPTPLVCYMFAAGNFIRVLFILLQSLDIEKNAMSGFKAKTINTILIIQSVLGSIIIGCTYLSSQNADYQAMIADMAVAADDKWTTDGFYIKFLLYVHGFFTLIQIPGVIAPGMALKQYVTVPSKLPTDKAAVIALEFSMGFQQLAVLMIQLFGAVMIWYMPTIDGIAIYWMCAAAYFTGYIFFFNILFADDYGFDRVPMVVFLILNTFVAGASFLAYFG